MKGKSLFSPGRYKVAKKTKCIYKNVKNGVGFFVEKYWRDAYNEYHIIRKILKEMV